MFLKRINCWGSDKGTLVRKHRPTGQKGRSNLLLFLPCLRHKQEQERELPLDDPKEGDRPLWAGICSALGKGKRTAGETAARPGLEPLLKIMFLKLSSTSTPAIGPDAQSWAESRTEQG